MKTLKWILLIIHLRLFTESICSRKDVDHAFRLAGKRNHFATLGRNNGKLQIGENKMTPHKHSTKSITPNSCNYTEAKMLDDSTYFDSAFQNVRSKCGFDSSKCGSDLDFIEEADDPHESPKYGLDSFENEFKPSKTGRKRTKCNLESSEVEFNSTKSKFESIIDGLQSIADELEFLESNFKGIENHLKEHLRRSGTLPPGAKNIEWPKVLHNKRKRGSRNFSA